MYVRTYLRTYVRTYCSFLCTLFKYSSTNLLNFLQHTSVILVRPCNFSLSCRLVSFSFSKIYKFFFVLVLVRFMKYF